MAPHNELVYGKDTRQRVVCVEPSEGQLSIFTEDEKGNVHEEVTTNSLWMLTPSKYSAQAMRLKGNQWYKYISYFHEKMDMIRAVGALKRANKDYYTMWDEKESALVYKGITYYKGMKPQEVSILFFDIETTGLVKDETSKVLLIANTFRRNGKITKKLFCYDDYDSEQEMFKAWVNWVRKMDPSIMCGHNVFGYDLPYMQHCSGGLRLGRDESFMTFNDHPSFFRKDGSQSYEFNEVKIFGREVVDTMFLSIKTDIKRKYESYGLKKIIEQEGLEKLGRVFYDAATIKDNYQIPEEWKKIKSYAKDDADDAMMLFDLMAPALFYLTQSVSKPFQKMVNTATGSQVNNMLVRGYLQEGKSIAKTSEAISYEGAISFGVPNVYGYSQKYDISSLYPSIIIEYNVYDKYKDPDLKFLQLLKYFTTERLVNKKLFKETKDRYYEDLSEGQKIFINSAYGACGAPGLNYNSPANAAFITKTGREILEKAILFATNKTLDYWKNLAGVDNDNTSEE